MPCLAHPASLRDDRGTIPRVVCGAVQPSRGRRDEPHRYDHVVIDEVQDFGQVELTVLLASARSPRDVTIAGDLNQKIVPYVEFIGWDALAKKLGIDTTEIATLTVAHRSTAPIVQLAGLIICERLVGGRPGPRPTLTCTDTLDAKFERIAALIRQTVEETPDAHVCVVFRHKQDVQDATARLRKLLPDAVRTGAR